MLTLYQWKENPLILVFLEGLGWFVYLGPDDPRGFGALAVCLDDSGGS